jgi:homocitrate synthase NifV
VASLFTEFIKQYSKYIKRVKLSKAWQLGKYAAYVFGLPISINQVGIGSNAFAHESGIHADGALKDASNYELYDYHELGRGNPEIVDTGRKITTGEYSGIKKYPTQARKIMLVTP